MLVVIQLSGGNDGLNTVVPMGNREYNRARPTIGHKDEDLIVADAELSLGLHPALGPIKDLMDSGKAASVLGVGYPNPNRSHFASMDVWHSGDTIAGANGGDGTGWIGRAMDHHRDQRRAIDPTADSSMDIVSIGSSAPMAATGHDVKPVAFENEELFRWVARDLHPALSEAYDQVLDSGYASTTSDAASAGGPGGPGSAAEFVYRTQMDAQVASDRIRAAVGQASATRWPRSGLANQLRMVAEMIKAEMPTTVYYVAMGGYDTHAGQLGTHNRLMAEFAEAVAAFQGEMDTTGQSGRVTTLAFSEFGRRLRQNASLGTDHGAAGPCFVFGDHLNPGFHGSYPSLTDLDEGDLKFGIDFRRVYRDLIDGWLGIDAQAALGRDYDSVGLIKPS